MSDTSQIGACMSDLVAFVHALVTEGETGPLLEQRIREIRTCTSTIVRHAENIAKARKDAPNAAR